MADYPDIYQSQLDDFQTQYDQLGREALLAKQRASQTGELTGSQLAAAALSSLLPIAIGGLISGGRGVQAGGVAGQAGLQAFNTQVGDRAERDRTLAEAEARQLDAERRAILSQKSQFERDAARDMFREGERNKRESSRAGRQSGYEKLVDAFLGERRGLGLPDVTGESDPTLVRGVETAETGESPAEVTASTITPQQEAALAGMGLTQNAIQAVRDNPELIYSLNPDIQKALAGTQQIASREQDFQKGGLDLQLAQQTLPEKIQQTKSETQLKGLQTEEAKAKADRVAAQRSRIVSVPETRIDPKSYKASTNQGIVVFDETIDETKLTESRKKAELYARALGEMNFAASLLDRATKGERMTVDSEALKKSRDNVIQILTTLETGRLEGAGKDTAEMRRNVEKRLRTNVGSPWQNLIDFATSGVGLTASLAEKLQTEIRQIEENMKADLSGPGATYFSAEEIAREKRRRQLGLPASQGGI